MQELCSDLRILNKCFLLGRKLKIRIYPDKVLRKKALGVKKGVPARCDQCHTGKFLWAPHCPHCGNPGPGTITSKKLARVAQGQPAVSYRASMRVFRVVVVVQVLFMAVIFSGFGRNGPFVSHNTVLSFSRARDPQAQEEAITRIEELASEPSALADLLSSETGPDR